MYYLIYFLIYCKEYFSHCSLPSEPLLFQHIGLVTKFPMQVLSCLIFCTCSTFYCGAQAPPAGQISDMQLQKEPLAVSLISYRFALAFFLADQLNRNMNEY